MVSAGRIESKTHGGGIYVRRKKKKEKCPAGMLDPMLSAYGEILSGFNNANICNNNHNFFFVLFKENEYNSREWERQCEKIWLVVLLFRLHIISSTGKVF